MIDEDERTLFREAVSDVRPLRATRKVLAAGQRPHAKARFSRADRRAVLQESLAAAGNALTPVIEAGEELLYRRPGVSPPHFTNFTFTP